MEKLSHLDEKGRAAMVDVSTKERTRRRAVAGGKITLRPDVTDMILEGDVPKGDVFQVARVAGIMAAKKTSDLVPMCHPLSLTDVKIEFAAQPGGDTIEVTAEVIAVDRTGVEMEALTAATAAALTVYDMCKAVQRDMTLGPFALMEKEGGKSGRYVREQNR